MEFLKLYKEENRDILYSMSWLNKNSVFDKSIGSFEEIDLFTFLENVNRFDDEKDTFYDDVYYILEYTKDSIVSLMNNINKEIKREHKILPISQAKEFDYKTIIWLSRQDGRTIKEKLKNNKIKTVKRYKNVDTYENRVFKKLLKNLVLVYEAREDLQNIDIAHLFIKIRQWLRSDDAKSIDEYRNIVYNNILLHHPHYSKIFKSYKWLNRLDEKVTKYQDLYPKQIIDILTFNILAKLQFKTEKLVLSDILKIDYNNFEIEFNEKCLPEKIRLLHNITNLKVKTIEEVNFNNVVNLENNIIDKQLNLKLDQDRTFNIGVNSTDKIFIDLFRLFPIASIGKKIINFPILLKQKIKDKIVNTNNTKVINLNHEIYTLPEILKTYNTDILRYFLEDFKTYFKDKQLNYIIPDYVNIFEFSQVKKSINSYFPNNRNIPKSILAGLELLFHGKVQQNDTLIYIQKNHDNDLYVTPLLVKYDKDLESITNGMYLEKHPTKKLKNENDILNGLDKYFNYKELSQMLLSKFLQNGIKGIRQQQIAFYLDEDIIYLQNINNLPKMKNRNNQIKALFHNKNLFKNKFIELRDKNEDNLDNFEKLLQYEKDNFILWKEHLPRLAMGDMPMDGYFGEFILVDDNSKVENNIIEIKKHFLIPANTDKLSFPLIFGEENINYEANITSSQLPFKENIECELKLTYDYEDETPYKLTFIPLEDRYKLLNVQWREIQYKEYDKLPIPSYPLKKDFIDFTNIQVGNKSKGINIIDWITNRISLDNNSGIPNFYINREINNIKKRYKSLKKSEFIWGKYDRNNQYFCIARLEDDKEVFCHSSNFKENIDVEDLHEGDILYIKPILQKDRLSGEDRLVGKNILFSLFDDKQIKESFIQNNIHNKYDLNIKVLRTVEFILLTLLNGRQLSDSEFSDDFRQMIINYINISLKCLSMKEIKKEYKEDFLFFLSYLSSDMPSSISATIVKFSKSPQKVFSYQRNFAFSLGDGQLGWQKEIFNNILDHIDKDSVTILNILARAFWRSKDLIFQLNKQEADKILNHLHNKMYEDIHVNTKYLELLFALLRLRSKYNILNPNDEITKKFIKIIDTVSREIVVNNLQLKTRIELNMNKLEDFKNTPDLLFALRMYLSGNIEATQSIKILGVSDD